MPQTYTLGKVAPTPRGAYNSSTQYYQLDIVSNNGSSYIVLQDCIGITPPNSTYYMQIASKGDTGDNGQSPTIAVGNVSSGEIPSVTNVGTAVNAVFDFVLPEPPLEQFVVTFTATYRAGLPPVWTANKTLSDVLEAINAGRRVVGIFSIIDYEGYTFVSEVKWHRQTVGEECVYFEYIDIDSITAEYGDTGNSCNVFRFYYSNDGVDHRNDMYIFAR